MSGFDAVIMIRNGLMQSFMEFPVADCEDGFRNVGSWGGHL